MQFAPDSFFSNLKKTSFFVPFWGGRQEVEQYRCCLCVVCKAPAMQLGQVTSGQKIRWERKKEFRRKKEWSEFSRIPERGFGLLVQWYQVKDRGKLCLYATAMYFNVPVAPWVTMSFNFYSPLEYIPTGLFTIVEPKYQETNEFYLVPERSLTDFKAPQLR